MWYQFRVGALFSAKNRSIFRKLFFLGFLNVPMFFAAVARGEEAALVNYPGYKFSGDLRFRHEHVEKQGASASSYEHQRIRARLGALISAEKDIDLEFRLATGAGRVSTNQTLGNNTSSGSSTQAMANYPFLLDRANVKIALDSNTSMKFGRFANPFHAPGDSDLIWDSDLNFDGTLWRWKNDGNFSTFLNAGFFWILKDVATPRKDVILGSAQGGFQTKLGDHTKFSFELGYHAYSGIRHHQGLTSATSTDGNTYDVSGSTRLYEKSFKLIEFGYDFTWDVGGRPLTYFHQAVVNTEANPRPGYLTGIKWGLLKEKGDWILSYDYRRVPENCTVGAFTDGDSFGGGTNGWSHRFSAGYQLKKSWSVVASYLHGKSNIMPDQDQLNRKLLQFDLNYKF